MCLLRLGVQPLIFDARPSFTVDTNKVTELEQSIANFNITKQELKRRHVEHLATDNDLQDRIEVLNAERVRPLLTSFDKMLTSPFYSSYSKISSSRRTIWPSRTRSWRRTRSLFVRFVFLHPRRSFQANSFL